MEEALLVFHRVWRCFLAASVLVERVFPGNVHAVAILASLLLSALPLAAQLPIHHNFEGGASGWIPYGGESARVHLTSVPAEVKNGKGSLAFEYEASATSAAAAVLPVPGSLAGMRSVCFWAMANNATALAVVLSEKWGGRYASISWLEPQVWQRIELTPEDFHLMERPHDPPDPDGKLDLDQISAIALIDVSGVVAAHLADAGAPVAIMPHTGPQHLFVDDFEATANELPWYKPRKAFLLDDFAHPHLAWFTVGGANLTLDTSGKILASHALKASYEQLEEHYVLMLHELPPRVDLTGATHLDFDVASEKAAHLILSLESETPGKGEVRYEIEVEVPGGNKPGHRHLALSAFEPPDDAAEDTKGEKLNWAKLKSIGLVDVTAAYTGQVGVNTLRIANIEAVKAAAPQE